MEYKKIIILTISILIFSFALLLEGFLIYLTIRKTKLSYFNEHLKKWSQTIKSSNYNNSATIDRFRTLSTTMTNYLDLKNRLNNMYSKMCDLTKEINPLLQNLHETITKYNLNEAKTLHKKASNIFKDYNNLNQQFSGLSDSLNKHWNTIEVVAVNAYEVIKTLEQIINESKDKLPISYNSLINELKELRKKTSYLEAQRSSKAIQDVSKDLNEHDRKVRIFAEKVSHLVNMEWLSFNYLPECLNQIKQLDQSNANYTKLNGDLVKIQDDFIKETYQTTISKIRAWLYHYSVLTSQLKTKQELSNFIGNNISLIDQNLNKIELIANNFVLITDEYKQNEKTQIIANFVNLKQDFAKIKTALTNGDANVSYLDIDAFINSMIDWINKFNYLIKQYNDAEESKRYQQYYLNILRIWYLYVISNKDLLEMNSTNEKAITQLINLNESFTLKSTIDENQLTIFTDRLLELCKLVYYAQTYKFMALDLINSISIYRLNNEDIDSLIKISLEKIQNKQYKDAFQLIKDLIRREKLDVH
ncbi:hypothetical protein KQ874_01110 [Mycoplasma sp. ES3157-GEN-MYC]|uniref:Septation ring formation regulator EzrA n=1 Tax=Mycoplasma miroungigenitalium TaxID=754515 RepID=A0A6M4JAH4_9MOLU|nr:hypothetical protein [Mycoplasma miroungigenitalium]MBU4690296.1 hypothetical protein [Mycoplasma miroungigenitalium]QJR43395.1 hypothetical protein HLA87_01100 [Mycoplasma miroungigenitalium]